MQKNKYKNPKYIEPDERDYDLLLDSDDSCRIWTDQGHNLYIADHSGDGPMLPGGKFVPGRPHECDDGPCALLIQPILDGILVQQNDLGNYGADLMVEVVVGERRLVNRYASIDTVQAVRLGELLNVDVYMKTPLYRKRAV